MAPTRRSKSVNKRVAYTNEVASKKKAENADRSGQRVSSCLVQRINLFDVCPNLWRCTLFALFNSNVSSKLSSIYFHALNNYVISQLFGLLYFDGLHSWFYVLNR